MKEKPDKYVSESQLLLSKLYRFVATVGFSLIGLAFIPYVFGILHSNVAVSEVASYWHLSSSEFAEVTGTPYGWNLFGDLLSGDMLSLASLVLIPVAIIVCLVIMIFSFGKKRDWLFMSAAILQIFILALAASGIISGN